MSTTVSDQEIRVPFRQLEQVTSAIYEGCGMSAEDAARLAHILVTADLRGVHTHGVGFVPTHVDWLLVRGVNPKGRPRVIQDNGAALLVDGDNGMGHLVAEFAMRQAIERARTTNVAVVAVRGSNHCGALAYYPMMALADDLIGLTLSNTLPDMPPWGSIDRLLTNGPIAVAIPAGEERPIVLDMCFQNSFPIKITRRMELGLPIPGDWAMDAEGQPTTDPEKALAGWGAPTGKYKGTGIALVFGILSAVLSGASFGTELGNHTEGPHPGEDGHFFLALKIAAFEDVERFKQRVDKISRELHAGRKAPGVDRILLPGERAAESEERYRAQGIPLTASTMAGLVATAQRVGADPSPLQQG
jgi:LDH2 family malate/lactate/ureidoglycolate dehydrogenase